jgi:hypothetical protein
MPASTAPHPTADQAEADRRALADTVIRALTHDLLDHHTAQQVLHAAGLSADGDVLGHAAAARYMRDGLLDGDIDPLDVEPGYTVGRDEAREHLAGYYDREYQDAVAALATPAQPSRAKAAACWFDGFLDRFLLNGGMPKWRDQT